MRPPSDRNGGSGDGPKSESGDNSTEDEWDPDPAQLRDGETPDVDAHARANLEAIREHEERGELEEGTAERVAREMAEEVGGGAGSSEDEPRE